MGHWSGVGAEEGEGVVGCVWGGGGGRSGKGVRAYRYVPWVVGVESEVIGQSL